CGPGSRCVECPISNFEKGGLMTDHEVPSPPAGLGPAGTQLWESVTAEYELGPAELRLLEDAAAEADLIEAMQEEWQALGRPMTALGSQKQVIAHPLLQELRQHRSALRQLILSMKLPQDDDSEEESLLISAPRKVPMSRTESAKIAAAARWKRSG